MSSAMEKAAGEVCLWGYKLQPPTDMHTQLRQRTTHKDTHENFSLHTFSLKISSLLHLTCFFLCILTPPTRFLFFQLQ